MKRIAIFSVLGIFLLGMFSCKREANLYQNINTEDAYNSVQDVENGLIGAYNVFASYRFYGRNIPALGDMASDVSVANPSSGHFININTYSFTDTDASLSEIWNYGYKVVDRCVRTINGAEAFLNAEDASKLSPSDKKKLYETVYQSYALKSLTEFYLVNVFGLPYIKGNVNNQLGIVLVEDKPIEAFQHIQRSSVEEAYALILKQIELSKSYIAKYREVNNGAGPRFNGYYFNEGAISAFEAQVALFMGNDELAASAAEKALVIKGPHATTPESYVSMWHSTAVSDEDIFTLVKAENDNLSANALNTLYGSYGASISGLVISLLQPDTIVIPGPTGEDSLLILSDIRRSMIGTYSDANQPSKWQGLPTAQAVTNIPVYRASGMYMIMAEAYANMGDIAKAQEALLFVAKRNEKYTKVADLPADQEALLAFIADENVREFFAEGHRWFDLRRTGKPFIFREDPYDVSKFVFPIPSSEVEAGFGVVQNPDWNMNLPE